MGEREKWKEELNGMSKERKEREEEGKARIDRKGVRMKNAEREERRERKGERGVEGGREEVRKKERKRCC